jgi:hypothetical protein
VFIIRLKQYSIWFLVNFFICLLPLVVALMIEKDTIQLFSGFISFAFTLLISSLYLFENYIYLKDEKSLPSLLKWCSWSWVLILLLLFILYPKVLEEHIKIFFNYNIFLISIMILIITIFFALLLNKPSIEVVISKLVAERKIKESNELKGEVEKMKSELMKESIK